MHEVQLPANHNERMKRVLCAIEGLSVGDAFGERLFSNPSILEHVEAAYQAKTPPKPFTDDTLMALSIVSILRQYGYIQQDQLARSFAQRYDPRRGYGPAMHQLLRALQSGLPWKDGASNQFEGQGSYGNGAAMRVAPVGAYFAGSMEEVVIQAARSAEVTHTHPEGVAGAIAVAVATAHAWSLRDEAQLPTRSEFIDLVLPFVPTSELRRKLRLARDISEKTALDAVVAMLGNGSLVSAQDTVPFTLWCAGEHLGDYKQAILLTASAGGDVDTTCAIVGGIVVLATGVEGIPEAWRQVREPLPDWPFQEQAE
ncbi:ADP-ribosylglycohydrolase [Thermosporothrix hazakensis]|jgi:ADP-ribosylglycohydrolase|uniref:ADP-ribosylglycohydrolase n=1 Tax=Thermosporothrix hazakensis TaxID=644383 RepID=A0A326U8J9_THEHA|nr:ADP-ribosylglycohydrolase family protein [Thermosporothrix hazakensis]PZW31130.1 ADP-ribosylglycohydrolase [Thermosporothrix hazakensis]GCE50957.1 hydrolase [Thermosporothrix hazakensis]